MSALRLLSETNISTSVSYVQITDVFSENFDIYKIEFVDFTKDNTTGRNIDMELNDVHGNFIGSSSYHYVRHFVAAYTSYSGFTSTSSNFWAGVVAADGATDYAGNGTMYLFNPFSSSSYTFMINQNSINQSTGYYAEKQIGVLKNTTSITGFKLWVSNSESIDEATIRVYGLRVDS